MAEFISRDGVLRHKRIPSGLANAAENFQWALDLNVSNYKWKCCLIYLDDDTIYSNTVVEQIRQCDETIRALGDYGITLKLKIMKLFIRYRRITGTYNSVRMFVNSLHTQQALQGAKQPRKVRNSRGYWDFVTYSEGLLRTSHTFQARSMRT